MLTDKNAILQVLGCLMKKPSLLSEKDKYSLVPNDFDTKFERYIFIAILNLYSGGAQEINEIDVDNYLMTHQDQYTIFQKQKGVDYLQDALDMCSLDNFEYYYNRIKKFNCLRDLKKAGYDISRFYEENELNPRQFEINEKFETLTTRQIFDELKKSVYGVEREYIRGDASITTSADTGIEELLEKLKVAPDAGPRFQGKYFNTITRGARKGKYYLVSMGSGLGKALPNSSRIPTPTGWKTIGEIKEGDYLFDALGKPTKVLAIYPQGEKEVFEVKFKDGRTVRCCDEHLWSYQITKKLDKFEKREYITSTLKDMMNLTLKEGEGYKYGIPQQKAVEYKEKKHFIPPYAFGLMLGDGSFCQHDSNKSFQYSSENEELPSIIGELCNWNVKKGSEKNYTWYFSYPGQENEEKKNVWVEEVLCEHLELLNAKSEDKYIPRDYLEDSIENRIDLLNGLLDSDGSVDERGRINYFSISPFLRDNVVELCQSLGFKTSVSIDTHKSTNVCYVVHITGMPEVKRKLFKLARKHQLIENWYNNSKRKERNTYNAIVDIQDLGYKEEMTCFYVDNEEHLFLTDDFVPTHNTRQLLGEACYQAFPMRYDPSTCEWKITGNCEKTLFIATEQTIEEIQTMIVAYLSGINEDVILYGRFTEGQQRIINQTVEVIKQYKDNLQIVRIPMPSVEIVKSVVRQNCLLFDIQNVFFDYIFSNPALLNEFRDLKIREDVALLMLSTALKDLAVEQDVFMMSATQVNSNTDGNEKGIKNQNSIRGSKAVVDKADIALIGGLVPDEQLEAIQGYIQKYGMPTQVQDVYKVRRGRWTNLKIWSDVDLGTCRRRDLFCTDAGLKEIDIGVVEFNFDENYGRYDDFLHYLNGDIDESTGELITSQVEVQPVLHRAPAVKTNTSDIPECDENEAAREVNEEVQNEEKGLFGDLL